MCMYCRYMHTHFLTQSKYLVICARWSNFLCGVENFRSLNVSLRHLWSFVESSLKALDGEGHFLPGYNFIVFSNYGSGTIRVFQLKKPHPDAGKGNTECRSLKPKENFQRWVLIKWNNSRIKALIVTSHHTLAHIPPPNPFIQKAFSLIISFYTMAS